MKQKAVFFDIDGTLVIKQEPVLPSTIEAIHRIRENGHLAFVCSGRSRVAIPAEQVLSIGFDGVLASCGAYGSYHNQVLFDKLIPPEEIARLVDLFRQHNTMYIFEGTDYIYYDNETVMPFRDDWYLDYLHKTIPEQLVPIQQVPDVKANKISIHVREENPEDLYRLVRDRYDILEHVFAISEFMPKGLGKAKGIEAICKHLGIDRADTIAVGDSINDVDMLTYAGIGVVMGNGTEVAKACADYITTDITEGGIYHAMEHLGLL